MFTSSEFRRIARDKLAGRWGITILVCVLAALLYGGGGFNFDASVTYRLGDLDFYSLWNAINLFPHLFGVITGLGLFSGLLSITLFVIGACVGLGRRCYFIELFRGNDREASVSTLFSRFDIFLKALGLRLYMALFIMLWSLLFVIPGIVAAYRYAMAPYLMAQNPGIGIAEAVNQSKQLMAGHKGRLFSLHLSFIGWWFLCCLSAGIGFIWLSPYVSAADTAFYLDRSGQGIPMREN